VALCAAFEHGSSGQGDLEVACRSRDAFLVVDVSARPSEHAAEDEDESPPSGFRSRGAAVVARLGKMKV
jgi:hypothetical protein